MTLTTTCGRAKILLEAPDTPCGGVHTDFLLAGADCITAGTYQASVPGFVAGGLSYDGALEVLERAVRPRRRSTRRILERCRKPRPAVASVGCRKRRTVRRVPGGRVGVHRGLRPE